MDNKQSDNNEQQNTPEARRKFLKKFDIFHSLPHWKKICYCIDLKMGCYIVCVIYILFIGEAFAGKTASKEFNQCYHLGPIMKTIGYVSLGLMLITFLTCLYFLYGIAREKPAAFICFMYLTVLLIIFNMVTNCCLVFIDTSYKCYAPYLFGGATYFGAFMLIFCLVVVNSYYRQIRACL